MKAYETIKDDENGKRDGKIMMCIEGIESDVLKVEKLMLINWKNQFCYYNEEGYKDGTIATFFVISRLFKGDFMADYKQAKKSLKSK